MVAINTIPKRIVKPALKFWLDTSGSFSNSLEFDHEKLTSKKRRLFKMGYFVWDSGKIVAVLLVVSFYMCGVPKSVCASFSASITFDEVWDGVNSEWDYVYYVENTSNTGETIYDFFLDTLLTGATLTNIVNPLGWETFTDNSTYIEWVTFDFLSEIDTGETLIFEFSTFGAQAGEVPYQVISNYGDILDGVAAPSAPISVPTPVTLHVLLIGIVGLCLKNQKISNGKEGHC